ncbi:MFS transporter [Streptomyces iakyrus]|uniref:MFS transporter n=1 Tax=Streptomyces iakyrus TaxID=68219 RepID=UPI000525F4C5|nr:MFS transporter [Streptomyces iakyrus]
MSQDTAFATPGRAVPKHERRQLTLLLIGQTTSVLGTQTTGVALPLLATGLAGASPLAISAIAAARYLPYLFLAVPAGILVDRSNPRRLMIAADALRLVLLALLPLLYFCGALSVVGMIAIVMLVAAVRVVFEASLGKYVIGAFDEKSWITVNSRVDACTNTGMLAGPPMAGAIAGAVGAAWALVLDAFTYAVSLMTVLRLRPSAFTIQATAKESPSKVNPAMSGAVKLVWRNVTLRYLAVGGALSNFGFMTLQGISVVYMVQALHLGSLVTGLVIAGLGVGSVVGAAVAPGLARRWSVYRLTVLAAPAAMLGPLSLMFTSVSVVVPVLGYALMGGSGSLVNVFTRRYRQGHVPADLYGRVSGVCGTMLMGMLPIGAICGGLVSVYAGYRPVLWISVVAFGLGTLSFMKSFRSGFRRVGF